MSKGGISMITVFDVATEEELIDMFGEDYDKEWLIKFTDTDSNHAELALLYSGRGDTKKSEEYLTLIKDDVYRQEILLSIHELIY
jgi:hypothetical protein